MTEPAEELRPHLSPSQLTMLFRCGESWKRRYLDGEKIPPGFAAMVGTGVHEGGAANFRQKIETHSDLPPSEITDIAVAAMQKRVDDEGATIDEGLSFELERGKAIDKTASLALYHAMHVAPAYQPELVEEKFRLPLPSVTHDLVGVLDLMTVQKEIVDYKTTTRKKQQREADESLALTTYAAGVHLITGQLPTAISLDVLVYKESGVERDIIPTTRDNSDFAILGQHVTVATQIIQAGVFAPAAKGSWFCARRWCGFFDSCPYTKK